MEFINFQTPRPKTSEKGANRWTLAVGEKMMLTLNEMGEGETFPLHSHSHEEAKYIIRGNLEVRTPSGTEVLRQGNGCLILSGEPHSARALGPGPVLYINIFSPPRKKQLTHGRHG